MGLGQEISHLLFDSLLPCGSYSGWGLRIHQPLRFRERHDDCVGDCPPHLRIRRHRDTRPLSIGDGCYGNHYQSPRRLLPNVDDGGSGWWPLRISSSMRMRITCLLQNPEIVCGCGTCLSPKNELSYLGGGGEFMG